MPAARSIRVRGIVQGVGFRPFVYRLASSLALRGWVLNGEDGVQIHVEGEASAVDAFARDLARCAPVAARIAQIESDVVAPEGFDAFTIRASTHVGRPTVRISPD